jgi:hypothetical protein
MLPITKHCTVKMCRLCSYYTMLQDHRLKLRDEPTFICQDPLALHLRSAENVFQPLLKTLLGSLPVDDVPNSLEVFRLTVLVLEANNS